MTIVISAKSRCSATSNFVRVRWWLLVKRAQIGQSPGDPNCSMRRRTCLKVAIEERRRAHHHSYARRLLQLCSIILSMDFDVSISHSMTSRYIPMHNSIEMPINALLAKEQITTSHLMIHSSCRLSWTSIIQNFLLSKVSCSFPLHIKRDCIFQQNE